MNILNESKLREIKKYFDKLKKKQPKQLDNIVHKIHNHVFEHTNCLECANCCKTTGPLFTDKDIERIGASFKMKPSQFVQKYLKIDEDKDYVLQATPCIFLEKDNFCNIYDIRPKACREYPHTDRSKFYQITDITLKNIKICPAAYEITENLKKELPL
ncbi:MAG: Fe-S-oxidoreductase [Bacteroidetes bacterium RIFCSPLOWO2_12_FULL_31_6]|nr:MAG: Fe-S-oxidoreductase [Bacteroidetes bacterium RIFCSPLOWO2_12_FULL_31_6]